MTGGRYHVEKERFDLAHLGACVRPGMGARNGHVDIGEVRLQGGRPRILRRGDARQFFAGGAAPALARDAGQYRRGFTVDPDHHVVKRRVRRAGVAAARVVGGVLAGVPAPAGEVEAPRKRHGVVDHHDLLVVGADRRMGVVVAQVDAAMDPPARAVDWGKFAIDPEHHREIPVEYVDAQAAAPAREEIQKVAEHGRHPGKRLVPVQAGPAVEVPAEDDDRALGALGGLHEGLEIVVAIDQQRDALGTRDRQAIAAWLEKTAGRERCWRALRRCRLVHA